MASVAHGPTSTARWRPGGARFSAGTLFDVANYVFLAALTLVTLYPFWETLVVSFMPAIEAARPGFKLWPYQFTGEPYRIATSSQLMLWGYMNTVFRTVMGTLLSIFLGFCTAYPLARRQLPYRNLFTIYFLIPMFFAGGLIPNYLLILNLGLIDTRWALILPLAIKTYYVLIMRNFIMTIPDSLEESAEIDGATFFQIMMRIIIPLSVPAMATIGLWVAVLHWNEWFLALIYTRSEEKTVLQLVLQRVLIQEDETAMAALDEVMGQDAILPESIRAATVMLSIGPIILVYPFVQKYFVKGILIGSLKG